MNLSNPDFTMAFTQGNQGVYQRSTSGERFAESNKRKIKLERSILFNKIQVDYEKSIKQSK